jgi:hypothetical protein
MSAPSSANNIRVIQASELPETLDEIVSKGPAFEFFQWAHPDAPTSEKIDIYRLDVIHHYTDPDIERVLDLTIQITNKETGEAVDLSLTRRENDRFLGFCDGKIQNIGHLPTFFDAEADLPRSPPPVRAFASIHEKLRSRLEERSQGIKTSFDDDEPDTGFKL